MLGPDMNKMSSTDEREQCIVCGNVRPAKFFPDYGRKHLIFENGMPICEGCIKRALKEEDFRWDAVNKICQMIDLPFVPKVWQDTYDQLGENAFPAYCIKVRNSDDPNKINWKQYNDAFIEMRDNGTIEREIPGLSEVARARLKKKWGGAYDDEQLDYLERLYDGILATQSVNGALSGDQVIKLCKISELMDERIEAGEDIDKLQKTYEGLIKVGGFTPKNAKNINDFDSMGELCKWMEKQGWKNTFYDGATRDIVDETIKNMQAFTRRLYTEESGVGEEINQRIENLREANKMQNFYGSDIQATAEDLDDYENEGFNQLVGEDEDFEVDVQNGIARTL